MQRVVCLHGLYVSHKYYPGCILLRKIILKHIRLIASHIVLRLFVGNKFSRNRKTDSIKFENKFESPFSVFNIIKNKTEKLHVSENQIFVICRLIYLFARSHTHTYVHNYGHLGASPKNANVIKGCLWDVANECQWKKR